MISCLGRDPSHEGRNFGTRLRKSENIVYEKEHVLLLRLKVFGHGDTSQDRLKSCPWRLVHLTENHAHFVQQVCMLHFVVQFVAFPDSLSHSSKDTGALVSFDDVMDQLQGKNAFS